MKKLIAALFLTLVATAASALEKEAFSAARFTQLQSDGAVVMIDVYAEWCATCKLQQQALKAYREKHPDNQFHILTIDFDTQKELVSKFRAPRQSTLLLYTGENQFWYSVAETRRDVIAAELDKAFAAK
jgi:thioredoxin 1